MLFLEIINFNFNVIKHLRKKQFLLTFIFVKLFGQCTKKGMIIECPVNELYRHVVTFIINHKWLLVIFF